MDFDGLPDGDEMHSSDDVNEAKKRKGRGRTMLDYNALSKAKQIGVQFNDKGQHFGTGSASLSSSAGILARQLIPVTYASWDEVPTILKDKLWAAVKQKYDLAPCRKKILLTQMSGCWRTYKATLTKQIRSLDDGPDAMEQMQLLKPANVEKQADWDKFVKHRCSPKFDAADVLQETIIQKVEGDVTNYTAKKNDDVANGTVFISGSQLDKVEASLGRARSSIREAALIRNKTSTHQDPDYVPRGPIYRNPNAFHRYTFLREKSTSIN